MSVMERGKYVVYVGSRTYDLDLVIPKRIIHGTAIEY